MGSENTVYLADTTSTYGGAEMSCRALLRFILSLVFLSPLLAENLLENTDFESGKPRWFNLQDHVARKEAGTGYNDSYGVQIIDAYPWGSFPLPDASGKMYKLSFMGKGSGFLTATALIDGKNNDWHKVDVQAADWRHYTITFRYSETAAEDPRLRLYAIPQPRGNTFWVDDLVVCRLGHEPDAEPSPANAELVELFHDGDAEAGDVEDDLAPAGWRMAADHTGYLRHAGAPHAYAGKLAVEARVVTQNRLFGRGDPDYRLSFRSPSVPVGKPKKVNGHELVQYWISFMARGQGSLKIGWHDLDNADAIMGSPMYGYKTMRIDGAPLTDDWQQYQIFYRPTDRAPTAKRMCLQFHLEGQGARVFIDDVSIKYDPDVIELGPLQKNPFAVELTGHHTTFDCRAAGQPVIDRKGALSPPGDVFAIAANARAATPGIGGRIVFEDGGSVDVDAHWKVSTDAPDGWDRADFDDSRWAPVTLRQTPAGETVMWAGRGQKCYFRRHILWKAADYRLPVTPNLPFAEGFANWFKLTLNPPVSNPITSYQFVIEMPASFTLVDPLEGANDTPFSQLPIKIESERVKSQIRYRLHFDPEHITGASRTREHASLIMIKQVAPLGDAEPAIHIYRIVNGNVSDLRTTIPIKAVPLPDGTRPKNIVLHDWVYPWIYLNAPAPMISIPYGDAIMRLEVAAGITHIPFDWRDYYAATPDNARHRALHRYWRMLADAGVQATQIWHDGLLYGGHETSPVVEYLKAHPEHQARFFNDTKPEGANAGYFPNIAEAIDGGQAYWQATSETYGQKIRAFQDESGIPVHAVLWDIEFPERVFTTEAGSAGFSDANKASFRTWAKLPEDQPLTDDIIASKYTGLWHKWTWEVRQQEFLRSSYRNCFKGDDTPELWVYFGQGMKYLPETCNAAVKPLHQSSRPVGNLKTFCDDFERSMLGDRNIRWLHILGESDDRHGRFPHRWEVMAIDIIKSAFATHGGGTSYFHGNPGFTANLYGFAEASRLLAAHERFFVAGKQLFAGAGLDEVLIFQSPPPDHGALQLKDEILLLVFNETDEPYTPVITLADRRKLNVAAVEPYWYAAIKINTSSSEPQ